VRRPGGEPPQPSRDAHVCSSVGLRILCGVPERRAALDVSHCRRAGAARPTRRVGFSPAERCGSFEGSTGDLDRRTPLSSGLGGVALRCNHVDMAGRVAIRFGWLIALTAVVLCWALVARTMANPSPAAKSSSKATAVVWGGLVFTGVRPLAHWLHAHGVAYSVWTGRHPRAAKTF
jgi:hypothetical protein